MLLIIILTGFLVGLVSTYFGIGGGVIIVPVLYTIFPTLPPETVISTSLGVIMLNNTMNIFTYKKKGLSPQYSIILPLTLIMLIGVFLGIKITFLLSPLWLKRIFSLVLIICSIITYLGPAQKETNSAPISPLKWIITYLSFFVAGIVSTTTGIGGGVIVIPLFIHLLKLPYRIIPVNTNLVVLIGVIFGMFLYLLGNKTYPSCDFGLSFLQIGPINFNLVFLITLFAFFTSSLGIRLSQKTKPVWSKRLFAAMLLVVAISFLIGTF